MLFLDVLGCCERLCAAVVAVQPKASACRRMSASGKELNKILTAPSLMLASLKQQQAGIATCDSRSTFHEPSALRDGSSSGSSLS